MAALPEEFSSLLLEFPANEGQKICSLVICCKMMIYRLSKKLRTFHREVTEKSNRKK